MVLLVGMVKEAILLSDRNIVSGINFDIYMLLVGTGAKERCSVHHISSNIDDTASGNDNSLPS